MSKKIILKNTLAQTLARLYSSATGFIASLLIINRLGDSLYGDFSKVTTLLVLGFSTLDFGLNAHVLRLYSANSNKKSILTSLIILRFALAAAIALVLYVLINTFHVINPEAYSQNIRIALYIGIITIFAQAIHISSNSIFQHTLSYHKMTYAVLVGATTNLLLTFISTLYWPTLFGAVAALSSGYIMTGLISLFFVRKYIVFEYDKNVIKKIFKGSLNLAVVLLFSTFANKSDIIIQGFYQPSFAIGQYSFAYRIFDFSLIFPVFFMNSLYPLMLKNISDQVVTKRNLNLSLKYLLILSLIIGLFQYLLSPFISYFKQDMYLSIETLKVLSLSLPFFYLTAPYMWNLISLNKEKLLIKIYLLATLLNSILNFLGAQRFSILSAAYITIITEAFILLMLIKLKINHENS